MAAPVFLSHASSLQHDTGQHPEQIARIPAITAALDEAGWLGFERRESQPASDEQLQRVHPAAYIAEIEALCARGGGMVDADTVLSAGSALAARHAAGGAIGLVDALLGEGAPSAFSCHRPPGHHALRARAMGFCIYANVAVAASHALEVHGLQRVLVLDWDVHHGNGTNDIFHADPRVLFVSIHESPLYPGSGQTGDVGSGAGEGYTINLPVPAGSGDTRYRSLVEHVVVPVARAFRPELVLLSAGYDAHRDDPLAGCEVTEEGYAEMTASMRRVCAELGAPLGAVLEGGYALGALGRSVVATCEVLAAPEAPAQEAIALDPLAERAFDRLAPQWAL